MSDNNENIVRGRNGRVITSGRRVIVSDDSETNVRRDVYSIHIAGSSRDYEFARTGDVVTSYISEMKRIRSKSFAFARRFEAHKSELVVNIQRLHDMFGGLGWNLPELAQRYPSDFPDSYPNALPFHPEHGPDVGFEDFTAMSYRFDGKLFDDFYELWMEDVSVYIDSDGMEMPRFLYWIRKVGQERERSYTVHESILLSSDELKARGLDPSLAGYHKYSKNSLMPFDEQVARYMKFNGISNREKAIRILRPSYDISRYVYEHYDSFQGMGNVSLV